MFSSMKWIPTRSEILDKPDGFGIYSEFLFSQNSGRYLLLDKIPTQRKFKNNKECVIFALYFILLHTIFGQNYQKSRRQRYCAKIPIGIPLTKAACFA